MKRLLVLAVGWLAGCAGSADSQRDLPPGWASATPLTSFNQSECSASAYDGAPETFEATPEPGAIQVTFHGAHFRCQQDTQAFSRANAAAIDILVQPVDMDPASVAKCDCLYEIDVRVPAATGEHPVSLYRRSDHRSGADTPTQVGSVVTITVP